MRRFWADITVFVVVLAAMAVLLLAISACASMPPAPPEPIIITRDVDRIVQVKCADMRPTAPDYPDDDEDLAALPADDIFGLARIYRAARALYRQRLKEDDAQIMACAQ